jgi:cytochrome c oxidase subunit 2
VGKGWSIFFGVVLLATLLLCVVAPFVNWWLPSNVASFGGEIDYLFYLILAFTAFFFVLTEVILVYNMFKFAYRPGHKSAPVYGNHRLELAWTIVPSAILLFIAFTQVQAWVNIKFTSRMPESDQVVQVMGRQWDWTIRYPKDVVRKGAAERAWAEVPEVDDLYVPEELHTWKGAKVKIYLKTQDVLHSFFMPNLRLKQDAVPGRTIPMWFEATDFNAKFDPESGKTEMIPEKEWEIACAELCGSGHYRMRGHVYVYETKAQYDDWLKYHLKEASRHTLPKDEGGRMKEE